MSKICILCGKKVESINNDGLCLNCALKNVTNDTFNNIINIDTSDLHDSINVDHDVSITSLPTPSTNLLNGAAKAHETKTHQKPKQYIKYRKHSRKLLWLLLILLLPISLYPISLLVPKSGINPEITPNTPTIEEPIIEQPEVIVDDKIYFDLIILWQGNEWTANYSLFMNQEEYVLDEPLPNGTVIYGRTNSTPYVIMDYGVFGSNGKYTGYRITKK